jgi:hypothetical protein
MDRGINMAFKSINATVQTVATPIVTLPLTMGQGRAVQIQNNDTAAIFIGTETVTTSGTTRGHSIAANANYQIWISGGDVIYGISAAGTTAGAVVIQFSA